MEIIAYEIEKYTVYWKESDQNEWKEEIIYTEEKALEIANKHINNGKTVRITRTERACLE